MKEEFCKYDQCRKLKDLGFTWATHEYYSHKHNDYPWMQSVPLDHNSHDGGHEEFCSAPTQSLVQKWLREEKKIVLIVSCKNFPNEYINDMEPCYFPSIITISGSEIKSSYWDEELYADEMKWYASYEEALCNGIDYCLKLLKEK